MFLKTFPPKSNVFDQVYQPFLAMLRQLFGRVKRTSLFIIWSAKKFYNPGCREYARMARYVVHNSGILQVALLEKYDDRK